MRKHLLHTYLLLLFSGNIFAQTNSWELKKNESGIKIYTRHIENSNFKEFKGEMIIAGKILKIIKVFKNVDRYKEWVADIRKVELLSNDENNIYYYAETIVPWPLDNRDMVYHLYFINKSETETEVTITGISDYVPVKKGIVRVEKAIGFWMVTKLKENKIKITYQLHVKPGGVIPAWLANSKTIDMPYNTLNGLRKILDSNYEKN